ncbi:hypothetical protein Sjap_008880 [Stephania japonica]|uniref:Protein kinase domain-containing protein n=1 Tax=Stephania japonica TaxID=461633 RepID=A0AAP0JR52_9MAGN
MAVNGEVVLVAVDASKEITEYALEWTICNVIKAMDCLILLATIPSRKCLPASGNNAHKSPVQHFLKGLLKKWGVRHRSDGLPGSVGIGRGIHQEENRRISEVGTQMMRELCLQHKISKVQAQVTVIADAETGSIAMKAEELGASWVILDSDRLIRQIDALRCRRLKKEGDYCSKHLINCNIILMDHTVPKILRLVDEQIELGEQQYDPTAAADMLAVFPTSNIHSNSLSCPSSLGFNSCSPGTEVSDSSPSMGDKNTTTGKYPPLEFTPSRRSTGSANMQWNSSKNQLQPQTISGQNSSDGKKWDLIIASSLPTIDRTSSVRRAKSLTIKRPLAPPPLCSICQYNAPTFGKSPRKYSYQEIQSATGGFSSANFLAEGGYGPVFRGVMPDGQVVAVKQHKLLSAQGTSEFCSEIEVLSCIQHRNLAMLVGYCIKKSCN